MKPIWKNKKLTVELHVPEKAVLEKARGIGEALVALNQPTGQALVDSVAAILSDRELVPERPIQKNATPVEGE